MATFVHQVAGGGSETRASVEEVEAKLLHCRMALLMWCKLWRWIQQDCLFLDGRAASVQ